MASCTVCPLPCTQSSPLGQDPGSPHNPVQNKQNRKWMDCDTVLVLHCSQYHIAKELRNNHHSVHLLIIIRPQVLIYITLNHDEDNPREWHSQSCAPIARQPTFIASRRSIWSYGRLSYTFHLQAEKNSSIGFRKGEQAGRNFIIVRGCASNHPFTG